MLRMQSFQHQSLNANLAKILQRLHYPLEVMLVCVRWYAAYPLSLRHLEEMMQERGVFVDHSTAHRWALKILPVMALIFRHRKRSVGRSWRMDETYIKVAGQWKYLYRAVYKSGNTLDFLLTAKRDLPAARRYLERAINLHGLPQKITIDKSGANTAAIGSINHDDCLDIELRQSKYLNNIVEQDHQAVKRITNPMLGFKSFWSAQKLIAGIETMHMVQKGQMRCPEEQFMSAADQFYSLAC
jgi:putative transposase